MSDFFSNIDFNNFIATASVIGSMFTWMMYRLDKKFDAIDKKFELVFQELKDIRKEINHLECRVARIEGQMISKECCMLKNDSLHKKAE